MTRPQLALAILAFALFGISADAGEKKARTPREALQVFNDLIGSWKCTGTPAASRTEFWIETMAWEWQFQKDDAWIKIEFDKGKYFKSGTLRYDPAKDNFTLTLQTPAKETKVFSGTLQDRVLVMESSSGDKTERLTFKLLHANRFIYNYDVRTAERPFAKLYQIGATKEGVPFAQGDGKPECVVSGGAGAIPVMYKGDTYYVCCTGCRDEFLADPVKYIKEFELKKKKK